MSSQGEQFGQVQRRFMRPGSSSSAPGQSMWRDQFKDERADNENKVNAISELPSNPFSTALARAPFDSNNRRFTTPGLEPAGATADRIMPVLDLIKTQLQVLKQDNDTRNEQADKAHAQLILLTQAAVNEKKRKVALEIALWVTWALLVSVLIVQVFYREN